MKTQIVAHMNLPFKFSESLKYDIIAALISGWIYSDFTAFTYLYWYAF